MLWCILHVSVDFCAFICLIFLLWVQNIDVDQIVEQYQSTCTPQPSISKLPPITPTVDKNFARQDESCLPPELCSNCIHGLQVCVAYLLCSISILICFSLICLIPDFDTARIMPRSCGSFAGNEGHANCYIK